MGSSCWKRDLLGSWGLCLCPPQSIPLPCCEEQLWVCGQGQNMSCWCQEVFQNSDVNHRQPGAGWHAEDSMVKGWRQQTNQGKIPSLHQCGEMHLHLHVRGSHRAFFLLGVPANGVREPLKPEYQYIGEIGSILVYRYSLSTEGKGNYPASLQRSSCDSYGVFHNKGADVGAACYLQHWMDGWTIGAHGCWSWCLAIVVEFAKNQCLERLPRTGAGQC